MTREEIDSMLRRAITEAGEVAKNILAPQEARMIAACVAGMALAFADQERRLRVLEPCPKARIGTHGPHIWDLGGTCEACGIVKGGGR